jgi:hypothetical protein
MQTRKLYRKCYLRRVAINEFKLRRSRLEDDCWVSQTFEIENIQLVDPSDGFGIKTAIDFDRPHK